MPPKLKLSKTQILMIAGIAIIIIGLVVFLKYTYRRPAAVGESFSLRIWGLDSRDVIQPIMDSYKTGHPGATIEYSEFDPASYSKTLLNALASGKGPDVFYIGNRELPKQLSRLSPLDLAQFPGLGIANFRDLFPAAAENDFVVDGKIYALPLFMDTMAMLYNRDMFDQAGIVAPPKTWDEFDADIGKIRLLSPRGQLQRAAAAIGGTENTVDTAVDLLNLLMLQNGVKIVSDDRSTAMFSSSEGLAAFNYYIQFENAGSAYFTWNESQPNSVDAFSFGRVAMIFNYRSALAAIRNKSPFLRVGVAPIPLPNPSSPVISYPKYYGLAVSRVGLSQRWAWDFAIYLTTIAYNEKLYLDKTNRPPALRGLIDAALADPDMALFARQALTARTWHEPDDEEVNRIFNNAIARALSGELTSDAALREAQDQINQLLSQ